MFEGDAFFGSLCYSEVGGENAEWARSSDGSSAAIQGNETSAVV